MRYIVIGLVLAAQAALAQEAEEVVLISRPKTPGVSYRVADKKFEIVFVRDGLGKAARPGQETGLVLSSDEAGSFSTPDVKKGVFIGSLESSSSAGRLRLQIKWRNAYGAESPSSLERVMQVEMAALVKEAERLGVRFLGPPKDHGRVRDQVVESLPAAAELIKDLKKAGYPVARYSDDLQNIEKMKPSPKEPQAREKLRAKVRDELVELYVNHVQREALLKALGLEERLKPHRISLEKLEQLAGIVLPLPELFDCFALPGRSSDDAATLNWITNQAQRFHDYAADKAGAAARLNEEERRRADSALMFSIKVVFTPDESAEKRRYSSVAQPFRGGLVGDALKEVLLNGRTDPADGSIVHWWTVETRHPRDFGVFVDDALAKTHVVQWFPRSPGGAEWLVRIRSIGQTPVKYSIRCSDTALAKGDSAVVFGNEQPLRSGFPY